MKNSNYAIENRNRDLPAYSAVPQPTPPPGAPIIIIIITTIIIVVSLRLKQLRNSINNDYEICKHSHGKFLILTC